MPSTAITQDKPINITHMQLFALLRYLHLEYDLDNNIGDEKRLGDHKLRFGQDATLAFQKRQVHHIYQENEFTKVQVQGFGMLGSNGALPLHITEAIYEKSLHEKDKTFNDFLDIFHHRLIGLFYKAWLMSEPVVMLDNTNNQKFNDHIASFAGNHILQESGEHWLLKYNQFYYASLLLNQNMPIDNLQEILRCYFGLPICIQQNIGEWLDAKEFATILSVNSSLRLGEGLLIGTQYYDVTQKFKIIIGPIKVATYLKFLRNGDLAKKLNDWVLRYTKRSYHFDVEVIVDKEDVAPAITNATSQLGQTSWLGKPKTNPHVVVWGC